MQSRTDGEPLLGTASTVRRWLLVEQPGPWGATAPFDSRMDADVAASLAQAAANARARLLLIRRPYGADHAGRRAYAAVSGRDGNWLERLDLADVADLAHVDLSPLRAQRSVGGESVDEPLALVCTNGSHDRCCARDGRPLATSLAAAHPELVWEATHVGGCRFAGNVVVLPDGLYYGHLTAQEAQSVVTAHRAGRLHLPKFRGRSSVPFAAQAAEVLVRLHLDLDGLDDVRVRSHVYQGDQRHEVRLGLADGREARAVVSVGTEASPRPLTCSASQAEHPPRYELAELDLD